MAKSLTPEGKVLQDLTTRFQVYMERLKAGEIKRVDPTIREFDKIVRKTIGALDPSPSVARVGAELERMRKQMMEAFNAYKSGTLQPTLKSTSDIAASTTTNAISSVVPNAKKLTAAQAWNAAQAATVQASGTSLDAFVNSWGESAVRNVEKVVRNGYAQGKTTQEIVRDVRGTRANNFRDGILGNATKREADAMVRTSIQHAASAGAMASYEANSDIIEGYIWISTLDSRTSSQCRSLDLQQFELGQGPMPPIHVNCRSTTIPKIAGVDLLSETTRATEEGQVPANQSYYEWLKGQDKEFQDKVLGKSRGALFRSEQMTADKFAELQLNKTFEPITVQELQREVGVPVGDAPALIKVSELDAPARADALDDYERLNDHRALLDSMTYEKYIDELADGDLYEVNRSGYDQWRADMAYSIDQDTQYLSKFDFDDLSPVDVSKADKRIAAQASASAEDFSTVPGLPLAKKSHFKNMEEVGEFWMEYENAAAINHILSGGTRPQQFFQSTLTPDRLDKLYDAAHRLKSSVKDLPDGVLLRGAVFDTEDTLRGLFPEGKVLRSDRFLSTTKDFQLAESYMDGQYIGAWDDDPFVKVLFRFTPRTVGSMRGYRLQLPEDYGTWDEVVLPPGTEFYVARYRKIDDRIEIDLEVIVD